MPPWMSFSAALVIWISSTAMKAPRIAPKIAIQSRPLGWFSARPPEFIANPAAPMFRRPPAASCGCRPSLSPRARSAAAPAPDHCRHALHDLSEIAGGVLRRQQRELRAAAWREAVDYALQMHAPEGVDRDVGALAAEHAADLRLLEIGDDVNAVAHRDDRHQLRARLDVLPDPRRAVANRAIDRRGNRRVAQIELGLIERGAIVLQCRLGDAALSFEHRDLLCGLIERRLVVL